MNVLVLGAGKMVEAILLGLKKNQDLSSWQIYSPSGTSAELLARKVGASPVKDLGSVKDPSWILVGCKPQQLKDLKLTLAGRFKDSLFVSVLAAIDEEAQLKELEARRLVRVMPSLATQYGEGVSLLSSTSARDRLPEFKTLFGGLGTALVVSERELDELTILTASATALFYEFSQNLFEAFDSLTAPDREALVRQVLTGSGVSAKESSLPLSEMIKQVTSEGGVTIAVLENWRRNGFKGLIKAGVAAGKLRSEELKKLIRG